MKFCIYDEGFINLGHLNGKKMGFTKSNCSIFLALSDENILGRSKFIFGSKIGDFRPKISVFFVFWRLKDKNKHNKVG